MPTFRHVGGHRLLQRAPLLVPFRARDISRLTVFTVLPRRNKRLAQAMLFIEELVAAIDEALAAPLHSTRADRSSRRVGVAGTQAAVVNRRIARRMFRRQARR
jgi:hypothetical protein